MATSSSEAGASFAVSQGRLFLLGYQHDELLAIHQEHAMLESLI